jgi:hypothetical protein
VELFGELEGGVKRCCGGVYMTELLVEVGYDAEPGNLVATSTRLTNYDEGSATVRERRIQLAKVPIRHGNTGEIQALFPSLELRRSSCRRLLPPDLDRGPIIPERGVRVTQICEEQCGLG